MKEVETAVSELFRRDGGRMLATLARALGDLDRAEEALQDALEAAMAQWPAEGIPALPRAWVTAVAKRRGVDRIRRDHMALSKHSAIAASSSSFVDPDDRSDPDDRLALFFAACHPEIALEDRVALTLRALSGLTTEELARAFLTTEAAMSQRLVRAKRRIRDLGIPFEVPPPREWGDRLPSVLSAIYATFNEAYLATRGSALSRADLAEEAIRLARLLVALAPEETETEGLLALMLLVDARRHARVDAAGELVLLEDQDRTAWDRDKIREGLERVARLPRAGAYALQASIAAEHARAEHANDTRWAVIAALYGDLAPLAAVSAREVIELNRAVAIAFADGLEVGLAIVEQIERRGELARYSPLFAAKADLARRLGQTAMARTAYDRALALVTNDVERRFLEKRRGELGD